MRPWRRRSPPRPPSHTLSPTQSTAAAGSSAIIGFTIGHGCEASPTRQVTIQIPAGITSVKPQPKAGWRITIKRGKLPEPVKDFAGNTVTVGVLEVTWTGGPLPDAYFDTFNLRLGMPPKAGKTLYFKTVQRCVKGVERCDPDPGQGPGRARRAGTGGDGHQGNRRARVAPWRRAHAALVAAALVALSASPAAVAHGGGAAKGYSSTVTSVSPAGSVDAVVLDGDDRLQLTVDGDRVVVITGYEGEPYLRFGPDGVFENTRSPAAYLNDDRYGKVELPDSADPDAPPEWERVAPGGRAFDWHDHRIHWMAETYPPVVARDPSMPHHVFDWKVPGTIDGAPLTVAGSLDYEPPPGESFPRILLAPLVVLIVLGVLLVVLRHRRASREETA